jgi:hypothetical protein
MPLHTEALVTNASAGMDGLEATARRLVDCQPDPALQ